jgi:hypothetical protein
MIARNFRRSQQQFFSSVGICRLPIFQNNFRRNAASASAAVKNTEPEQMEERIGGVPVQEGPSTSLPVGGERQIPSHIRELVCEILKIKKTPKKENIRKEVLTVQRFYPRLVNPILNSL